MSKRKLNVKPLAIKYKAIKEIEQGLSNGILYKTDPDLDPDFQKKETLYQNSLYELKTQL